MFVSDKQLTNGQVIDIRTAAQNLQATNLWDMSAAIEKMGFSMVDGTDSRMIGVPGFDANRGKLLIVSAGPLSGGNPDVATVVKLTLTGENQDDLFTNGLARSVDGSVILVGSRSFSNAGPGKFYYIPRSSILF